MTAQPVPITQPAAWLKQFWLFARPHTIIGTSLSVFCLYLIAASDYGFSRFPALLLTWISCLGANVFIVGLNQLTDVEIDRINKPKLPLAAGTFTVQTGWIVVTVCVIVSLIIALGMMVDNAVVIIENIYRFRDEGYGKWEAARKGTGEVGLAVCVGPAGTSVSGDELTALLEPKLAKYKLPQRYVFLDEMPKTGYGKITKRLVREALEAAMAEAADDVPLGRVGTADEVAELIALLLDERAAFATGADFPIDGGLLAELLSVRAGTRDETKRTTR